MSVLLLREHDLAQPDWLLHGGRVLELHVAHEHAMLLEERERLVARRVALEERALEALHLLLARRPGAENAQLVPLGH